MKKREGTKTVKFALLIALVYLIVVSCFVGFIIYASRKNVSGNEFIKLFLGLSLFTVIADFGLIAMIRFAQYKPLETNDARYAFYASRLEKCAFLAYYEWNGSNPNISIPDEINGYKVIALGGTADKKVQKFHIKISPQTLGCDKLVSEAEFSRKHKESDSYETLILNIHIGKNLFRFNNVKQSHKNAFLVRERINLEGQKEYDFVYKIVYRFEVDEANEHIYSKDGRLYNKKNDNPIMEFNYE